MRIAFLTLLERKLLRFAQNRKGPNLVGPLGILQPFSDGLKLLIKENSIRAMSYQKTIIFAPLSFFFLTIVLWLGVNPGRRLNFRSYFLFFLIVRRVSVLALFFSGWGGQRTYSLIGGIRSSAQIISYEVILSFLFLYPLTWRFSLRTNLLKEQMFIISSFLRFFFLWPLWIRTILAETNRAPFDLTEGERELVRGFNTEYSSVPFVFLFLAEYGSLLFFSLLSSFFLLGKIFPFWIIFLFLFLVIRACYPRKRYDWLIDIMWVLFFPLVCLLLGFLIWLIII